MYIYDNAQRQALWRTRRQQERALVVKRLRTWTNAVANADLVHMEQVGAFLDALRQLDEKPGQP